MQGLAVRLRCTLAANQTWSEEPFARVSLGFPWQWAWKRASCPLTTAQTPAPIAAPHFPSFHLLLNGAKDWGKSC